jgi:hypothetical protein
MDNPNFGPADPAGPPAAARSGRFSGRAKRVVTVVGASAILLGGGAAVGTALTGGAAAATGSAGSAAAAQATGSGAAAVAAGRCAVLVQRLRSRPSYARSHPALVNRLKALCGNPLLRLASVGGEHGQVTFHGKTGTRTVAFERGTVESVSGSTFTVRAADGTTWTWQLIASTAMRQAGKKLAKPVVSNGEFVFVEGLVSTGVNEARLIQAPKGP